MTSRLDNPLNSYLLRDQRGNLLPGGRMEFFDDDTDSPRNVYEAGTDLTVSLGNVVYADAYGLLPDFDLTPNQDYKVRVFDADGAAQWTRGGVANNISNLEARVSALESAIDALGSDSGPRNLLTNGGCKAVRHQSAAVDFPVRADWSPGELAAIFAQVGSADEGLFRREFDTAFVTGTCALLDDVTTSSSESQAEIQWRMPSGDGAAISGDDVVLRLKARQNSGSTMNAYLTLYKCLVRDDFGGDLVTITSSAPVSLNNNELTELTLAVAVPGDLSTGVVVVLTFDCGVVSNTNFAAGDAQLERGLVPTQFEDRPQLLDQAGWYEEDLQGVGELKNFPGATQAPPGTVIANRGIRNRADYPRLWAFAQLYCEVVSDAVYLDGRHGCYSSGDGSTTFRTPDYTTDLPFFRARSPSEATRPMGELQEDQNKQHTHGHTLTSRGGGGDGSYIENGAGSEGNRDISSRLTIEASGGDEARPVNFDFLPCITI